MIDLYKQAIQNQFDAAFCTLCHCVRQCPDEDWHEPVVSLKFCQVAFHALFFADLYLGHDVASQRDQDFHRLHAAAFAGYEELEDRPQQRSYTKPFIEHYLGHCRAKASHVIESESADALQLAPGFPGRSVSRAELHFINVRHLFHHAAQLTLHLRKNPGTRIPWVQSGWQP